MENKGKLPPPLFNLLANFREIKKNKAKKKKYYLPNLNSHVTNYLVFKFPKWMFFGIFYSSFFSS